MHTSLASHLHSDKCNKLIELLQNCHQTHTFKKYIGACNKIDKEMNACLKQERLQRRHQNYLQSVEKKQRIRERMMAMDDELKNE